MSDELKTAAEQAKDPSSYSLITYAWVLLLSAWGGMVAFLKRVREGHTQALNLVELVGEICTSAFTGLVTFFLCEAAHFQPLWTAVMVAISGHMGARAIFVLENIWRDHLLHRHPPGGPPHDHHKP